MRASPLEPSAKRARGATASGKKPHSPPPYDPDLHLGLIEGITRPQLSALSKLGISTLRDLLQHYPRRHEDRRMFERFPDEESGRAHCLTGTVGKTVFRRFGGMRSFEAELEETPESPMTRRITLRWFNLFHVRKSVLTGKRLVVHGRLRLRGRRLWMEHPEFEVIGEDGEKEGIHLDRIVPIHPAGDGIGVRVIRKLIHRLLDETDWNLWTDPLGSRRPQYDWGRALRSMHFPKETGELETARRELALRELLGIQTMVTLRRNASRQPAGCAKKPAGKLLGAFLEALPFALTGAQKKAVRVILDDMALPHRMHRLLQGDVGSGKTVVAAAAMLAALESAHSAVLMAPTQILAEQHHRSFQRWFSPLGIPVELFTGNRKEPASTSSGPAAIIGTHALLHRPEAIRNAGMVVIDEQHKFGVLQRTSLSSSAAEPDLLIMTATPIPRTLAQTLYGDLDFSILDERPSGRGALRTAARSLEKLPRIIDFFRGELDKGRQGYVVYPLVDDSGKLEAKAAAAEIEAWSGRLAPHPCLLLHGRMKASEKEAAMESFRRGETKVLVTTTVIEVGVDVPNATFLLVENAERFGLAQLHQLRGRIGRGEHTSTCVLIEGSGRPEALSRLEILEKSNDGFVIAEEDLRIRGAGDILGTAQSGLPPLRIADLPGDADLLEIAASEARRILGTDPELKDPSHASLRELMNRYAAVLPATGN